MIFNITNIFKRCQAKEIKIKDQLFEHYNNHGTRNQGIYMSKKKINELIKSVIKHVDNGEEHKKGVQQYEMFDQFGETYRKCLCIKDLLEDAYYIREHGVGDEHDEMLMEIDSVASNVNGAIVKSSSFSASTQNVISE